MLTDKHFLTYIRDGNRNFTGWDFSTITETGRMQHQLLSWSYGSQVMPLVQNAASLLDMGTGGGEFLSEFKAFFPKSVYATEGYKPNIPIAKQRLEPLGVKVVQVEEDTRLPFEDSCFDLIINRHESYSPQEVKRIISDQGLFITQQSGGTDCRQINEKLGVPLNEEFAHWNLNVAMEELKENGFRVTEGREEYPVQRFYDIGALVYYLKAIPWQVPGFEPELYLDKLYEIHGIIQKQGYFDVYQHRFIIKAEAI
ncbi:methyltransferase domain-containing protein [Paenibacillus sp. J2TS4]|uniref:methyltransferase domain-containing protein n=1 Tax=Paenibacillus sp. J2TS4 TaxID=2807194 RepID=UPI001B2400A8|nr:methyltransferase domain-containing protein [Paenibacillus sp. J2TS4]GIP34474.1 methyltransferase [Paenibacillus sp. J2TS4]